MKVLLISGSPNIKGNTTIALGVMEDILNKQGIKAKIYHFGGKKFLPCTACGSCFRNRDNKCILQDDLNDLIEECREVDGIVLASPVHYADISGIAKCAFDRLFYVSSANGNIFRHKVGASVIAVRRSGGMPAFHQLNNYLTYSEMFIVGTSYWNVIHGQKPGEVLADAEGVQTLQTLADNMAYLMKTLEASQIEKPELRKKARTNFIREDLVLD